MRMRRKKNLDSRLAECNNLFEIITDELNFTEAVKEKEYLEFEKIFGRKADKRRKLYNGMLKCQAFMYFKK